MNPPARRVAVTSRDGVAVNERFHRARDYFIFEAAGQGLRFVERRERPDPDRPLRKDLDPVLDLLADCDTVVSLGFHGAARKALIGRGFAVVERRGTVEELAGDILSPDRSGAETKGPMA